ncbi:hypothetical protein UPYG_G00071930 [Umbra pygmaea]|uniref:Uncharacterized protein n=1 Tax=Umbra pygmaea TaxID=75934 RepID=A0ABD0Y196_UMBPY
MKLEEKRLEETKASSRKRPTESKRDDGPRDRKRSKDDDNTDGKKHTAKHLSSLHPRKPLQEPKITSNTGQSNVKKSDGRKDNQIEIHEINLFAPIDHLDMERSDKKSSKESGDSKKDKQKSDPSKQGHDWRGEAKDLEQKKVCELSANSSVSSSKKNKDSCENNLLTTVDIKKEHNVKRENGMNDSVKKSGNDKIQTAEKKRKKKPGGEEELKKKRKDGEKDGKTLKSKRSTIKEEDSKWK